MRVLQYQISTQTIDILNLPEGAEIVHVDMDGGIVFLYVLVGQESICEQRNFVVVLTGESIPANTLHDVTHIGTFLSSDRTAFHVFEIIEE